MDHRLYINIYDRVSTWDTKVYVSLLVAGTGWGEEGGWVWARNRHDNEGMPTRNDGSAAFAQPNPASVAQNSEPADMLGVLLPPLSFL